MMGHRVNQSGGGDVQAIIRTAKGWQGVSDPAAEGRRISGGLAGRWLLAAGCFQLEAASSQ